MFLMLGVNPNPAMHNQEGTAVVNEEGSTSMYWFSAHFARLVNVSLGVVLFTIIIMLIIFGFLILLCCQMCKQ